MADFASKVQSQWRKYKAREQMQAIQVDLLQQKEKAAALNIQCQWRGGSARRRVKELVASGERDAIHVYELQTECALMVQCHWRGKQARRELARLSEQSQQHAHHWRILTYLEDVGRWIKHVVAGALGGALGLGKGAQQITKKPSPATTFSSPHRRKVLPVVAADGEVTKFSTEPVKTRAPAPAPAPADTAEAGTITAISLEHRQNKDALELIELTDDWDEVSGEIA